MVAALRATREKRIYNRWVANETMEDFALRFTAHRARRWSYGRVANTAIGSISFLALEAIGGAITLTYGFDVAVTAIMLVGAILFLTGLPISYYAARYGLEFCLGVPLFVGYVVSSLAVIPLVVHGFSKISAFQTWTQPLWVLLHILPFVLLAFFGYDLGDWIFCASCQSPKVRRSGGNGG